MNRVLGSNFDGLKVGPQHLEQQNLNPKLNFLNALKGSAVNDNKCNKTLGMNTVHNLQVPPFMADGHVTVASPLNVFEDGCELWQSTLVGYFMG
jgi:hypothetical protein